jgi:pilus assembly protein CpaE
MQTSDSNQEHIAQAVFSVCASSDVSPAAMQAVGLIPGSEFIGDFPEYITADRRPQFSAAMKGAAGCVALIDCDRDPEQALETMERLQAAFPNRLSLVAVAAQSDASFLLRAMRAGCSDFLDKPVNVVQLTAALNRFLATHSPAASAHANVGRMISFFGVKGGVGTTTLAVHLAIQLVRKHGKKVLLIDHKHELGHVALHLGIEDCLYYFDEIIRNVDRLDANLLDGFVTHHPSGLDVIPSPDRFALLHDSPAGVLERIMDYLRTRYDYVLVDSSTQYSGTLATMVHISDEVCLISTPDVAALRDLVRHTEQLNRMKGFVDKLRIFINRSTSVDAVNPEQIQGAVKFPVTQAIPNSYLELMRALNAGEPIPMSDRGAFSLALETWGNRLTSEPATSSGGAHAKKRFAFWR